MRKTERKNLQRVTVVALAVGIIGLVSLERAPRDLLPVFNTPTVQIVTFYSGMPSEVMEPDIMSPLERWTGQSVGIEHQEAKAMMGVCVVKDFFREDISLDTAETVLWQARVEQADATVALNKALFAFEHAQGVP